MPRVEVPAEKDPLVYVWSMAPGLTSAAARYSQAVYDNSQLGIREFEAARITIARINDCTICTQWRTAREVPGRGHEEVPEEFYERVGRDPEGLTEREQLAAEFAERYATDHLNMGSELWDRLRSAYSDEELVDLALCVASWLALGRFNRVFDIDGGCRVP